MNAQIGTFENWDEVRTAYHVARLGTLSAAAAHMGVHHATVIRHIDALEDRLGSKLFHRHARGYTPTEAGNDLLQVAAATEDQLTQLAGRMRGASAAVSGELIVTTLSGLSPQFTPLLVAFQKQYPDIQISFVADDRTLKLEYGEAHVAIRAGARPQEPDNVVQELIELPTTLYAHRDYVDKYGPLLNEDDIPNHRFVASNVANARAPTLRWMSRHIPEETIIYRASEMRGLEDAIHAGAGIGFVSFWSAHSNPDLVQMMPARPEWKSMLWLVTHVDLHRTAKVQALVSFLKSQVTSLVTNR